MGNYHGKTHQRTKADDVGVYKLVLKGKYLEQFNKKYPILNAYDTMCLGDKLYQQQKENNDQQ